MEGDESTTSIHLHEKCDEDLQMKRCVVNSSICGVRSLRMRREKQLASLSAAVAQGRPLASAGGSGRDVRGPQCSLYFDSIQPGPSSLNPMGSKERRLSSRFMMCLN